MIIPNSEGGLELEIADQRDNVVQTRRQLNFEIVETS